MQNTSPKIHPNFCYLPQLKIEKTNKSSDTPKKVLTRPKKTESSSKIYNDLQKKKMKFHENVEKLSLQTICNLQRKPTKQDYMPKRETNNKRTPSFLETCVFTSQKLEPMRKTSMMKIAPARFKYPNCPKSFSKTNKFDSTSGFSNFKTEQCEIEPFDGNFKEMDANFVLKTEPCEVGQITIFEDRRQQEQRGIIEINKQEPTEQIFETIKGKLKTSKEEQAKLVTTSKEELTKLETNKQELRKPSTSNKEQHIKLDINKFETQGTTTSTKEIVTFRKDTSIHDENEHINPTITLMNIEEEDAPIRLKKVEEALQLNSKKYLEVASDFRVHKASFDQIRKALIDALNMIFELKMDLNDV